MYLYIYTLVLNFRQFLFYDFLSFLMRVFLYLFGALKHLFQYQFQIALSFSYHLERIHVPLVGSMCCALCNNCPLPRVLWDSRLQACLEGLVFCLSCSSLPPALLVPSYLAILWLPPSSSQHRAKSNICSSGLPPLVMVESSQIQSPGHRGPCKDPGCRPMSVSSLIPLSLFPSLPHFLIWNNETSLTPSHTGQL